MSATSKTWPWTVPLPVENRTWPSVKESYGLLVSENVCVSRAGLYRTEHSLDKDGRCVFCDWMQP